MEVLIASSLLVIALAGAFAMVVQTAAILRQARDHYVATTLCLARIERARDVSYGLLSLLEEPAPGTVVDHEGIPDEEGHFRRSTLVRADSPEPGTTTLWVTTEIRDRKTLEFEGPSEEMTSIYTTYLEPPD